MLVPPSLPLMLRRSNAAISGDASTFYGAENTHIHGGSFTTVGGNMTVNHLPMSERPGFKLLLKHITKGASYNAAERRNPPKCHPNTRTAVLAKIMEWIKTEDPRTRDRTIIWLYGPAGSGKTAICQSIAEACAKAGLLAASFFFGRLAKGRNTTACVVATLAYQLSRSIPEIEDQLLTTIERDPTIFSLSLATQMHALIVEPLMSMELPGRSRIVVMDGVNECGPDDQTHKELLSVLGDAADALRKMQSILFLVGSRPEYEIRTTFSQDYLGSLTRVLVLDDEYAPDDDIRTYFDDRFFQIQQTLLPFIKSWPATGDVDILVKKASGQFIFAATVIRFVESPRHHPPERLSIILDVSKARNETPFAGLDALYQFILSSVTDIKAVLQILMWLVLTGRDDLIIPVDLLGELLRINIHPALVDMHALIFVPPPADGKLTLRIYHAALSDFLMDRNRSLRYHIDDIKGHMFLSERWLEVIGNYNHSKFSLAFSLSWMLERFVYHCGKLPPGQLADILKTFNLQVVLEGLRDLRHLYSPRWNTFFTSIRLQAAHSTLDRIQNEFDAFILSRISQYPQPIRKFFPAIFIHRFEHLDIEEFFFIFFGLWSSESEFEHFRQKDKVGLDFMNPDNIVGWCADNTFIELVTSEARARGHFQVMDEQYYVSLAKHVIRLICPLPEEDTYDQVRIRGIDNSYFKYMEPLGLNSNRHEKRHPWLCDILENAACNLDLAFALRERALQYINGIGVPLLGRKNGLTWKQVAEASLAYIQKCEVPYLEHTHLPETTDCVICAKFGDEAIVSEKIPNEDSSCDNPSSTNALDSSLAIDMNMHGEPPVLSQVSKQVLKVKRKRNAPKMAVATGSDVQATPVRDATSPPPKKVHFLQSDGLKQPLLDDYFSD